MTADPSAHRGGDTAAGTGAPPAVELRRLQSGDYDGVTALLIRSFPSWPGVSTTATPRQYLEWLLEAPAGRGLDHEGSLVGLRDGNVVSSITGIPRRFKVGGEERLAIDGVNIAVAPELQGQGIYRLMQQAESRVRSRSDFEFTSPGYHPAIIRANEDQGTRHLPMETRYRILDAASLAAHQRAEGRGRLPLPLTIAALRALQVAAALRPRPRRTSPEAWTIRVASAFPPSTNDFWRQAREPFDVIQVRDREFLNWRYADHRGGDYAILLAEAGGALLGYLAARFDPDRVNVCDLLALPARGNVVRSLLSRLVAMTIESGSREAIVCWIPRPHPYRRLLRSLGFLNLRRPTGFGVRLHRPEVGGLQALMDPATRFHVMHGDSDLV